MIWDDIARGLFPEEWRMGEGQLTPEAYRRTPPQNQMDSVERRERDSRIKRFLKDSVAAGAPGCAERKEEGESHSTILADESPSNPVPEGREGPDADVRKKMEEMETFLRWAELELVTVSLRCKEDLDEIAFWRNAPDHEISRARRHLAEMAKRRRASAAEQEMQQQANASPPTLAKRVHNDDPSLDHATAGERGSVGQSQAQEHSGSLSRIELEIRVSDLSIALRRERWRVEELERKVAESAASAEDAKPSAVDATTDESLREEVLGLRREKQEIVEELKQARDQLSRFNKEQARDGRTIAELSEWCEKLQAQLVEATIPAPHPEQQNSPAADSSFTAAPSLCKMLPSPRQSPGGGPQLAKKLPSPASSHRLISAERNKPITSAVRGTGSARVSPHVTSIAVTTPKEPSWFNGLGLGGGTGKHEGKLAVLKSQQGKDDEWFGAKISNPLNGLLGFTSNNQTPQNHKPW